MRSCDCESERYKGRRWWDELQTSSLRRTLAKRVCPQRGASLLEISFHSALDTLSGKGCYFREDLSERELQAAAPYQCEGVRPAGHTGTWRPLRPGGARSVLV